MRPHVGRLLTLPTTPTVRSAGVPPAASARRLKPVSFHTLTRITRCGLECRAPGGAVCGCARMSASENLCSIRVPSVATFARELGPNHPRCGRDVLRELFPGQRAGRRAAAAWARRAHGAALPADDAGRGEPERRHADLLRWHQCLSPAAVRVLPACAPVAAQAAGFTGAAEARGGPRRQDPRRRRGGTHALDVARRGGKSGA